MSLNTPPLDLPTDQIPQETPTPTSSGTAAPRARRVSKTTQRVLPYRGSMLRARLGTQNDLALNRQYCQEVLDICELVGIDVTKGWLYLKSNHDLDLKPYVDIVYTTFQQRYGWDKELVHDLIKDVIRVKSSYEQRKRKTMGDKDLGVGAHKDGKTATIVTSQESGATPTQCQQDARSSTKGQTVEPEAGSGIETLESYILTLHNESYGELMRKKHGL